MKFIHLIAVCLLLSIQFVCAQTKQYQFARIDRRQGLSHHMVNDIVKDSTGFLWFATSSGLNRYDGYSMKVYRNIQGDTSSLPVSDVNKLFEGPEGKLWTYSHAGTSVYDPQTETFFRNVNFFLRKFSVAEGLITYIKKDSKGNYWFVHYNQGLFRYSPSEHKTTRYVHDDHDQNSLATMDLSEVQEDQRGNIWVIHKNGVFEMIDGKSLAIAYKNTKLKELFPDQILNYSLMSDADDDLWVYSESNHGCFLFNKKSRSLEPVNTSSKIRLNSNIIRKIVQDDEGIIWIATDHGGVNLINKKDFSVRYILHDDDDDKTVSENNINTMYKDREGIVWIGTYRNGIAYYHPNIFQFQLYRHNRSRPESLPYPEINSLAEDDKGNLWIGTNGGGLVYFDRKNNKFRQYVNDPKNSNAISNNVVVSLLVDHENILWVGTYYGGLDRFDGKTFTHFRHDPQNPKSLADDSIWELLEDSNHNIWIGTLRGGADVYSRSKNEFFHYRSGDLNSIHTSYVPALMEDKDGNVWVGTGYGVEVLEKESGRFVHYLNDINNPSSISNNNSLAICQDSRGWIWVGTQGGLNLFNKDTKSFRSFHEKDGLETDHILRIVEDNQHNLWMSTPKGLSKLIIESKNGRDVFAFKNYDESDGLQPGAFHENAGLKCRSGEMVFGGSKGFNIFRPEEIGVSNIVPKVIFTDFQIFNKSAKIGEVINKDEVLAQSVSEAKEIVLGPANNVFSIEFAALNFFNAGKCQYQYKMEGFSKSWLTTNATERKVTFTNLDPGSYVFQVKASNSDGVWNNKPAMLRITVLPPFWKTNWAFFLYAVAIVSGLFFLRWLALTKERMNYKIRHEREEARRMHELDMMKIKFFTNVSHEFRTPLTLILTPMEKMLRQATDADQKNQFKLIHRNARRLLNLVNQLLDFRKMEFQEVKFNPSEGDIVHFIHELVNSFSDLSEKKHIELSFYASVSKLETFFDQDKIEKILFNLLSNAFKFTPSNGKVQVNVDRVDQEGNSWLEIKVSDTGIGVPADKLDKIFERFFQHELPGSMVNQGSGIGLSITHEFVRVHGGTIHVTSETGKGSCFTVRIPVREIHQPATSGENIITTDNYNEAPPIEPYDQTGKPALLLIEDNEDFRFYLKDNLKMHYSIIEAGDGKEGFEKATSFLPDLIVSDVMMPEMNGIELCRQLKADKRTSHIPVILLTARTAEEQKLEGFESGASDYITKPFSFEILQSRIKNLIAQRELGQKQFQKHLDVKASEIQVTSHDEKFIQETIKAVESNMENPNFSVEELSRLMGVSRVLLYKKLLALTGKTPIEFIRTLKLQRAAQLLEKSQYTVSEIAYQVGFNNPKYFAKYFKDEFGKLPSVFASEKRGKKKSDS